MDTLDNLLEEKLTKSSLRDLEEWKTKMKTVNDQYKAAFIVPEFDDNIFRLWYRITCWETRQPNGFAGPSTDPNCQCIVCDHAGYHWINHRDLNNKEDYDTYIRCFTESREQYGLSLPKNY